VRAQSPPSKSTTEQVEGDTTRFDAKPVIKLPLEKSQPQPISRFEQPPIIDGNLNEKVWLHAVVLKEFYQTQPGDNLAPSYPTELLLGYDSKNLYIAFRAFDDPRQVRATVAKRDDIQDDDTVQIYLDTFNDQRRAYFFFFNPFGIQQDGILTEATGEDYSVDVVFESKGVLTDFGYVVEAAIPFSSLRYEAGKGKLWGIQSIRRIKHANNEQNSWMPLFRDKSGFLSKEGHITGLEGISTERTLELIPSATVSETGKRGRAVSLVALSNNPSLVDAGRFVNQPIGLDLGLTAKLGITPSITLDLALNPDFAQVEADQPVVTVNQRFPIFFAEKRPFFLEGIDIFQTLEPVVHTRTIIDPSIAIKLSGKRARNSFGVLLASDKAPGSFGPGERESSLFDYQQCLAINLNTLGACADPRRFFDKSAAIGIVRMKHDLGEENNLGFILTDYSFIEKHNVLAGFDGRFRVDPQTHFSFQVLGTTSRRYFYDADLNKNIYRTGNALGYFAQYEKATRHFNLALQGKGRMPDYRADLGFTQRTNTNSFDLRNTYNSEPSTTKTLTQWGLGNISHIQFDWKGRMQYAYLYPVLFMRFKRQAYFNAYAFVDYERLFEEEFGPKRTPTRQGAFAGPDNERSTYYKGMHFEAGIKPSKKYSLDLSGGRTWDYFDYDFGGGKRFPRISPAALTNPDAPLDPGPGDSWSFAFLFKYQPTDPLQLSLQYEKSKLVRDDTSLVAYDAKLVTVRASYQFTRFMFARARVDYDSIASNLRGQFLVGWAPNPGTAFYVGYNDDVNRNGFNPFTGQLEPGFRRNGRTFFIKMSYLFRRSL